MFKKIIIIFLFFISPVQASALEQLSVDFDTVIQDNFLGVNAVYHAFSYLPESIEQGMTAGLRNIEFDRIDEIDLHLARTFYRPDWAMGEGIWTEPDWNSVKMEGLYSWLAAMKKRNVDVALNMGWWFARDVIWNRDQHLPRYPDDVNNYVEWVSESLRQIIELRKFTNVKYIMMFTEPGGTLGDIPHGMSAWEYYKVVLKRTHDRLLADNRRHLVKMVGPNTSQAPRWVKQSVRELDGIIDIYASHHYNFDTYDGWFNLATKIYDEVKGTGKPFWVDEYGIQDLRTRRSWQYGNIIATANAAFLNAGSQTSLIWILNDQYYPYPLKHITNGDAFLDGKHSWGLYPWLPESAGPRPAWYAFGMLSRLLGGKGTRVYETSGKANLHIAAVRRHDQHVSILVVNAQKESRKIQVKLSEELNGDLYRYLYDPAALVQDGSGQIGADKKISSVNKVFVDEIPGKAFAVYSTLSLPMSADVAGAQGCRNFEDNLAFQKEVIVSSSGVKWPASNLTDGKRLTGWTSRGSAVNRPESIVIDLGRKASVCQVDIYPGGDKLDGALFPEDFIIMVSEDKMQWEQVVERTKFVPAVNTLQSFQFEPTLGRYVLFSVKSLRRSKEDGQFRMKFGEFKVRGNVYNR